MPVYSGIVEVFGPKKRTSSQNELEYQVRNWFYFNWLCGDHIVEQHIHNADIINWIKGSYPIKANGHGGRQVRGNPANDPDWKDHGEIYDHHFVEFEYADGFGCTASAVISVIVGRMFLSTFMVLKVTVH